MRKSRAPRLRSLLALALVSIGGVMAACGFDGLASGPELGGAQEAGPPGESGADTTTDTDSAAADEGGSTVLLDDAGALPEDPVDAGLDGACPSDAFRCAATNTCVTRCGGCPAARFRCRTSATCVGACAGCADLPFECAACDTRDQVTPVKFTCETAATSCYEPGSTHCDCTYRGCWSAEQVCASRGFLQGYECRTCGEGNTNNGPCVGPGNRTCNGGLKACK